MDGKNKPFQNRIVGYGSKVPAAFKGNPNNWRKHPESQGSALNELLSSVGWVTGVIENQRTGNLIDGHARIETALANDPSTPIPFVKVDLSEGEEKKILLLLDPVGSMATTDEDRIQELMRIVGIEDDSLLEALSNFTTTTVPDFEPATLEEQGQLDKLNLITCPNCNHEFPR